MKKVFLLIGVFLLLFGLNAAAEEKWAAAKLFEYTCVEEKDDNDSMELFALSSNEIVARDLIAQGMRNHQTTINFSHCRIARDRIFFVVIAAYLENPELYYVHDEYKYHYITSGSSSYVFAVELTYLYTKEQVEVFDAVIEKEKQHVLSMMDSDMTDLEKVMLVHNYITVNHTYDYSYTIYNIYDFFTKRTGVCQAYALAMNYLLRAAGVECAHAYSYEMNHDWNLVKFDGNWYHVDATWNDSGDNCSYKYFLKSDDEFVTNLGHYAWDSEYEATSAWYDDYYFTNYKSPFLYMDGEWYVQKSGSLYKINNLKYGGSEKIFTPDASYKSNWYPTEDICFAVYKGSFIFNVQNEVFVVNLKDYAKPRKIAGVETAYHEVYNLYVNGDVLYYLSGSYAAEDMNSINLIGVVSPLWFEINDVSVSDGWVYLRYNYDQYYDGDWCIYVASYKDDTMIAIQALEKGKSAIAVPEADRYEAFIWEGCMPLSGSVSTE
ncbi:MAG: hypothetical protein IJ435_09425 [Clostridia bacterium]|nr:hypothetical protein [Clostridia bacterium]